MEEKSDTPKPRIGRFGQKKNVVKVRRKTDPEDVAAGQVVTDIRKSSDPIEAVRDRLCLWPTGNEIVTLLRMMQEEQMNESWRQTVIPCREVEPEIDVDVEEKPPSPPTNSRNPRKVSKLSDATKSKQAPRKPSDGTKLKEAIK